MSWWMWKDSVLVMRQSSLGCAVGTESWKQHGGSLSDSRITITCLWLGANTSWFCGVTYTWCRQWCNHVIPAVWPRFGLKKICSRNIRVHLKQNEISCTTSQNGLNKYSPNIKLTNFQARTLKTRRTTVKKIMMIEAISIVWYFINKGEHTALAKYT